MKMKKMLAMLTALLMMVLSVSGIALAEKENIGDKTASPTALTPDNRETTVTLSLPSDEYKNKIDVVFVMDFSTSIANGGYNFGDNVQSLFNSIVEKNPTIDMKVGVVKFTGYASDILDGLKTYDDSTKGTIIDAINVDNPKDTRPYGSGSNAHGGLIMAEDLLSGDSDVPDDHKYVVFLTDGKNYIWNNSDNEPVAYHAQYFKSAAIQSGGVPGPAQNAGQNKEAGNGSQNQYSTFPGMDTSDSFYGPVTSDGKYYQRLYDSSNAELSNTETEYDFPCYYTGYYPEVAQRTAVAGSVTKITPSNGTTVFDNNHKFYRTYYQFTPQAGTVWENIKFLSVNPYLLNDEGLFDTSKPNPDFFLLHPSTMEKGLYQAGHYWKEVIDKKYNTGAIVAVTSTGGGLGIAASFDAWLTEEGNSDFSAWITESDSMDVMFDGIDNHINYLVDAGSVVTDIITDDFTLKESENPFTITVAGTTQTCTKTGDNTWNFGSDGKGGPAYEISYDPGTKTITWKINVPIMVSNQVKLSYELTLREDAETGEYPTNKSAVLNYKTTDGEDGTFTFPIPKVTYTVNLSDITVTKVWKDNENASKLRPDSITVHLLSNGDEVEKKTITQDDNWTGIFEGLPDAEYTIKEDEVEGYTASISGNSNDGFTITNAMNSIAINVTVKKVWNDNDNILKLRPDSINVRLLSNGKEVASKKVTKADKWTCTFENLPDGEYTVKEDAVDGYRASVSGSSKEGFTVTNTLTNQPEPSKVPTTGDGADLPLWFGLLFLGIIGLGAVAAVKGKR